MSDTFLDKAYGYGDDTRKLYNAWAASYDKELSENGYMTPGRCAKALRKFVKDAGMPVLDFGCGTGLSGLALKLQGFEMIDGVDVSKDMAVQASEKGVYHSVQVVEPGAALPFERGTYGAIAAIGVIGSGAAPVEVFDLIADKLGNGGLLVMSYNDHALAEPEYEAKLNEYLDCGTMRLVFKEYGDHIPGIGLKSNVYVLEKA